MRLELPDLARQRVVGEALPSDLPQQLAEAVTVGHGQAVVVAERGFIQVAVKVKRFDRNVGSLQCRFKSDQKFSQPFVWQGQFTYSTA